MASELFAIASRAVQRRARREWHQTLPSRSYRAIQRHFDGQGGRRRLSQLHREIERYSGQKMARDIMRQGGPVKYGFKTAARAAMNELFREMGPFGSILQAFLGNLGGGGHRSIEDDLKAATNLLEAFGYEVIPRRGSPKRGDKRWQDAALQALTEEGVLTEEKAGRGQEPVENLYPFDPRSVSANLKPHHTEGDRPEPFNMLRTPESSNVYAYGYDNVTSILYVQFQSPDVRKGSVAILGTGSARGTLGSTLKGKAKTTSGRPVAGPMYAYFDVPHKVYVRMVMADSKGEFVWDHLRVRGSLWGHQYQYRLVQGAIATGAFRGWSVDYVPRRAVSTGFEERSVRTRDGRQVRSLLPAQWSGLGSSRPNRGGPNRGAPKRGEPNRGRPS